MVDWKVTAKVSAAPLVGIRDKKLFLGGESMLANCMLSNGRDA